VSGEWLAACANAARERTTTSTTDVKGETSCRAGVNEAREPLAQRAMPEVGR
jgi:hypothetical protein